MKFFLFGLIFVSIFAGCIQKKPAPPQSPSKKISPAAGQSPAQQKPPAKTDGKSIVTRLPAMLIRIVDGDTLEVSLDNIAEKVRLLGINSPETVDPRQPVQCFGHEAAQYLKTLLPGKNIFLQKDSYASDRDQYGRLLRYVYNEQNLFVNVEMVKNGYALAYTPGALEHFSDFRYYEKIARDANLGLWNANTCPYKSNYGK